jgi:hypothetical protein
MLLQARNGGTIGNAYSQATKKRISERQQHVLQCRFEKRRGILVPILVPMPMTHCRYKQEDVNSTTYSANHYDSPSDHSCIPWHSVRCFHKRRIDVLKRCQVYSRVDWQGGHRQAAVLMEQQQERCDGHCNNML